MGSQSQRLAVAVIGVAIAAVEWVEILAPPWEYFTKPNTHPTITRLLLASIDPENREVYQHPILGWILIINIAAAIWLLALVLGSLVEYYDLTRRGIVIIDMDLSLEFLDEKLSKSILHRKQRFHTNKRGISAYHFKHSVDGESGKIITDSIMLASSIDSENITKSTIPNVTSKKIDLVERFETEIPTNIFLKFIPFNLKRALVETKWFSSHVVLRESTISHSNEYNGENPILGVSSVNNPLSYVSIQIAFPQKTAPKLEDISAYLIKENVITDIKVKRLNVGSSDTVTYGARAKRVVSEQFRLQWRNVELAAYEAALTVGEVRKSSIRRSVPLIRIPRWPKD